MNEIVAVNGKTLEDLILELSRPSNDISPMNLETGNNEVLFCPFCNKRNTFFLTHNKTKYFCRECMHLGDVETFYKCKSNIVKNTLDREWIQEKETKTGTKYEILYPALIDYVVEDMKELICVRGALKEQTDFFIYSNSTKLGMYEQVTDLFVSSYITDKYLPRFLYTPEVESRIIKSYLSRMEKLKLIKPRSMLNSYKHLANCKNGMVDMRTLKVIPHDPKYYSTIQIPCDFKLDATSQNGKWDTFLDFFTSGKKDTARFLLQWIGAVASNVNGYEFKTALWIKGESNTGKTVFNSVIQALVGDDNYCPIELQELEGDRFASADLYNKRLSGSADASYLGVNELGKFKKLTGGDPIRAQNKGEKAFKYRYEGFIQMTSNGMFKHGGDKSDAVYNRFVMIEANNVPAKPDKRLLKDLLKDLEYILMLAFIEFSKIYDTQTFTKPSESKDLVNELKTINNPVLLYKQQCMKPKTSNEYAPRENKALAWAIFQFWGKDNNIKNINKAEFDKIFPRKVKTINGKSESIIPDYELTYETIQEYAPKLIKYPEIFNISYFTTLSDDVIDVEDVTDVETYKQQCKNALDGHKHEKALKHIIETTSVTPVQQSYTPDEESKEEYIARMNKEIQDIVDKHQKDECDF